MEKVEVRRHKRRVGSMIKKGKFYPTSSKEKAIIYKEFERDKDAFEWIISMGDLQERGYAGIRGKHIHALIKNNPRKYQIITVDLRGGRERAGMQFPADE